MGCGRGSLTAHILLLPLLAGLPAVTTAGPLRASAQGDVKYRLGRNMADAEFERHMDLNADGVINILDIASGRLGASSNPVQFGASTEQIVVETTSSVIPPGGNLSLLVLLKANITPVLGYSLDVRIIPDPSSRGALTVNTSTTNFFDSRNLITAGGATRDPFFSVIQDNGVSGVFVNTITDDDSTVLALDGVNDVLVQVMLQASADACGPFSIELGNASALSDGSAQAIPYSFSSPIFLVNNGPQCNVPAASDWGLLVFALLVATSGTCVFQRRSAPDREHDTSSNRHPSPAGGL